MKYMKYLILPTCIILASCSASKPIAYAVPPVGLKLTEGYFYIGDNGSLYVFTNHKYYKIGNK